MNYFSDGKISLKGASKKYISAQPEGTVSCDKDKIGEWEKFEWLTVYTNPNTKVTLLIDVKNENLYFTGKIKEREWVRWTEGTQWLNILNVLLSLIFRINSSQRKTHLQVQNSRSQDFWNTSSF